MSGAGSAPDLTAGIAVTALVVPKNLGYAEIAGVPLQNGLYAAAAGAIIYALFCTSRHISTGPSSSLAAVAGGAVILTGLQGDEAAQLVAAITLATGVLFLAFAAFRLGWIAQFLSKAVVTGFLAGAAVDVVVGELPIDRRLRRWRQRLAGAGILGRHARRYPLDHAGGRRCLARHDLGVALPAPAVPGALVLLAGEGCLPPTPWTLASTAWHWWGTCRGDSPPRRYRASACSPTTSRRLELPRSRCS